MKQPVKHIIDDEVILGCTLGKQSDQHTLYNLTVLKLYNVVLRMIANKQETEDVLQESYIRIFAKINQFDKSKGNLYSWMCKICINMSINHLKRKRFYFDDIDTLYIVPNNEISIVESMEVDYILGFINQLPEQNRIIFNLFEIEGYNHREIAELLSINVNSSRVYLSRAKSRLQKMIKEFKELQNSKTV